MANLRIVGGAYALKAPIAVQECINLFPEVQKEGAQEQYVLRRFPGLKLFDSIGSEIRGEQKMGATLYVVSGTSLYSVDSAGTETSIGTIAGTGLVSMANDGTNLVIVNGATGYVYNGSTLSTITDADFLPSDKVVWMDTYFIFKRTGTNDFFISNAGSAIAYDALDIASKEGAPGDIVSILTSHRDLFLFGEKTTEIWRNIGDPDFAFARQDGAFIERGVIGRNSPVQMDNTVYFLGDDRVVYALPGPSPVRISHHAIEKWLSEQSKAVLDDVIGMTITYQGHYWYILSFTTGTWVYDATASGMLQTREWFQLKSWEYDNWRVDVVETCYGKILCGDGEGNIYELDPDTYTENGSKMLKRRTSPFYHNERKRIDCPRLELSFEEGVANSDVTDPKVFLEISKDGGRTWSSRRERSMGQLGEYTQKAVWRRNGPARTFAFRWTVTDDVDVSFIGAYGEFGSGNG